MKPTPTHERTKTLEITIKQAINAEVKKSTSFEQDGNKFNGSVLNASITVKTYTLASFDQEEKTGRIDSTFEADIQISQVVQAGEDYGEMIAPYSTKETSFSLEMIKGIVQDVIIETPIKLL
jgi:hypothetical protein